MVSSETELGYAIKSSGPLFQLGSIAIAGHFVGPVIIIPVTQGYNKTLLSTGLSHFILLNLLGIIFQFFFPIFHFLPPVFQLFFIPDFIPNPTSG